MGIKKHLGSVVLGMTAISWGPILLAQSPGLLAEGGVATRQLVRQVEIVISEYALAGFTDAAAKTAVTKLTGIGVNPALAAQGITGIRTVEQAQQVTKVLQSLSAKAAAQRRDISWVTATALKRSFTYTADSPLSVAIAGVLTRQNTGAHQNAIEQQPNISPDEVEGVLALNEVASVPGAVEALSAPGSDSKSARELVALTRKIGETHCLPGAGMSHGECVSQITIAAVNMATKHRSTLVRGSKWVPLVRTVAGGFPGTDTQGVPYASTKNFSRVVTGLAAQTSRPSLDQNFISECLVTGGAGGGTF